jgi:uncharacterized protein
LDLLSGLLVVAIIGFFAQLVDGSLGMGYGVTSATMLAGIGYSPVVASATIHVAKIGTGVMSGVSHWRFGNVHWRATVLLAIPGAIGAFIGAFLLSNISAKAAAPWVSLILAALGLLILVRTVLNRKPSLKLYTAKLRTMGPLGLVGGFIDALGGGGWGPVTTSTLMAANRLPPNKVIGTVSASETVVAIGATVGFLLALGTESVAWGGMVALLAGGLVAAPIAAWLVSRLDHALLGGLVGGMILFYNAGGVLSLVGVQGQAVLVAQVLIILVTTAICVGAYRRKRSAARRAMGQEVAGAGGPELAAG